MDIRHFSKEQILANNCVSDAVLLSRRRGGFDCSHLRSSNLSHYLGVLHSADSLPGVGQVLQAFQCPGRSEALHVDVVAGQGHIWVKVVARKAQALHLVWAGRGQYGEKDLLLQAKDYLVCAKEHPINFNDPKLAFVFYNGVTKPMANHLESLGISIVGEQVDVCEDVKEKLVGIERQVNALGIGARDYDDDDTEVDIEPSNTKCIASLNKGAQRQEIDSSVDDNLHALSDRVSPFVVDSSNDQNSVENDKIETICDQPDESQINIATKQNEDCSGVHDIHTISFLPETNSSQYKFIFSELLIEPLPEFEAVICAFNKLPRNSIGAIKRVNLDVTALITLVSNVSNGSYNFRFNEKVLSSQAEEERTSPVKPVLSAFLKDKDLYACESAVSSFQSILELLGGAREKQRAADLLERVTVTPDCPSFRTNTLMNTGKIKDRSKIIFGTGDSLKAVTVTANSGFVRAAEHQGVTYAVFIHASRALTEQKEPHAERIPV